MQTLCDKYRPRDWSEVIGQDKARRQLDFIRRRHGTLGGRCYWLSGPPGTGKTTIARLIAGEVADDLNIKEIDGTKLTGAMIDELAQEQRAYGMGEKSGRAFIVNEAHGLNKATARRLLTVLESGAIPAHVVWIFTTSMEGCKRFEDGEDTAPLLHRCAQLPMSKRNLAVLFAKRAQEIARAEGIDGKPIDSYLELVKQNRNSMRAVLEAIDNGAMADLGAEDSEPEETDA